MDKLEEDQEPKRRLKPIAIYCDFRKLVSLIMTIFQSLFLLFVTFDIIG